MNVGETLKAALGSLVENRVWPNRFPQEATPTWPAIRYTVVSREPDQIIEGTDDGETDDIRVQLDIVTKAYADTQTLRGQVVAALQAVTPPCVRLAEFEDFDAETKTHRAMLDVQFHPSSSATSPD